MEPLFVGLLELLDELESELGPDVEVDAGAAVLEVEERMVAIADEVVGNDEMVDDEGTTFSNTLLHSAGRSPWKTTVIWVVDD